MAALVIACLLMGGGSRADIASLALLRPLAAVFLVIGLFGLTRERFAAFRFLLLFGLAIIVLFALQLVPLPPQIWTALPGRDLLVDGLTTTGATIGWQPLSMVPWRTWNSLYALIIPAAALLLAIRCTADERRDLVPLLLLCGLATTLLGVFQAAAPGADFLWLYRITNQDLPVGFFANRNHQAVFLCCLPLLLALWAGRRQPVAPRGARKAGLPREAVAIGAILLLLPLVLVTGSRAGLLLFALAIVMALGLYAASRDTLDRRLMVRGTLLAVAIGGAAMAIAFSSTRSLAVSRLMNDSFGDDLRAEVWPRSLDLMWNYMPLGTGFGSFAEVFQIGEQSSTLNTSYVNRVHNDWIEPLLEGGIPAGLLMVAAVVAWLFVTGRLLARVRDRSQAAVTGLAGSGMLLLLALSSVGDYPLRVPMLMVVATIAALWMRDGLRKDTAAETRSYGDVSLDASGGRP